MVVHAQLTCHPPFPSCISTAGMTNQLWHLLLLGPTDLPPAASQPRALGSPADHTELALGGKRFAFPGVHLPVKGSAIECLLPLCQHFNTKLSG